MTSEASIHDILHQEFWWHRALANQDQWAHLQIESDVYQAYGQSHKT